MDRNRNERVVVNLVAGLEEPENVLAGFVVATCVLGKNDRRTARTPPRPGWEHLEDHPEPIQIPDGPPRLARLTERFGLAGGELYACVMSLKEARANPSNNAYAADANDVCKRLEAGGPSLVIEALSRVWP